MPLQEAQAHPPTTINSPQSFDLQDIDAMATILKVPKSWLYGQTRQRGKDTIPHLRFGKYLRFRPADVIAWAEQRAASR